MPVSGDIDEKLTCGLPPCVALGGGSMLVTTIICAAVGLSPAASHLADAQKQRQQRQDERSKGLYASAPNCTAETLKRAPAMKHDLMFLPARIKALGDELNSDNGNHSASERARAADRIVRQYGDLHRTAFGARAFVKCEGGAERLLGVTAAKLDRVRKDLRALVRRAKRERSWGKGLAQRLMKETPKWLEKSAKGII